MCALSRAASGLFDAPRAEELAEENQKVKGVILALEDDLRIRRALAVAPNIEFYRYQINFKLFKN